MMNLGNLLTERRNPYTLDIDKVSSLEMCLLINEEDKREWVWSLCDRSYYSRLRQY